jgi:hypothetical protein
MQTIDVTEPSATVPAWEYMVAPLEIHAEHDGAGPRLTNAPDIAALGEAGWELVSVAVYPPYAQTAGVFKRAIRTES